jgi:hypothetical protein
MGGDKSINWEEEMKGHTPHDPTDLDKAFEISGEEIDHYFKTSDIESQRVHVKENIIFHDIFFLDEYELEVILYKDGSIGIPP